MIDVNVHLSRWPTRRLRGDETGGLAAMLREHGVTQAWAGSFDGLLHKDIAGVNERLAAECEAHKGFFVPFGSVNPTLPAWEEDLRRVHEVHRMPGIRLHPNYHGYALKDAAALRLLTLAAERGLVVQIVMKMEDERTQHRLLRVPTVDAAPLEGLRRAVPGVRLMVLNSPAPLPRGLDVYCDFSMLETSYAVKRALTAVGEQRVVFGSHAPFYYFDAAALKLRESGVDARVAGAIQEENARRFFGR